MTDHPSPHTRSQYLRGLLGPEEFLEVDDHLAGCAECRDALAPPFSRVATTLREGLAGEHLPYEQMERYVDGTLGAEDAVLAEAHIDTCAMCAEEVDDLGRVAREARPQRWLLWGVAAAAVVILLGSLLLFRRPQPDPFQRPETPGQPTQTASTASTVPRQVPVDRVPPMNAALKGVLDQLAGGVLPSAALIADLRPAGERIRGGDEEDVRLTVAAPRGVVEEDKPLFSWNARSGATYVVEVFDSSYQRVARSETVRRGEWRASRPLPRGAIYAWQLTETRGDTEVTAPVPPEPPARFKVIDDGPAAELDAARKSGSHLDAALVYAREGIVDRALAEMRLAAQENPDSAEIRRAIETLRRYQPAPTATKPAQ